MRSVVEYWIFKDYPKAADWWDGPFKTKTEAYRVFNEKYRIDSKRQDFLVVKHTLTPTPLPAPKAKP